MPTRRPITVVGAALALAAGAVTLGAASPSQAETPKASATGAATAVVLRTGLDVSLLNNTAHLPLNVSVNDVHAPADAHRALLTARLDGVDGGRQFDVLRADVATSHATADDRRSQGSTNLTHAVVRLPGLSSAGLVGVEAVTSTATCEVGKQPTAHITMAGDVTVLGKKVSVTTRGTVHVDVPGVGQVALELAKKTSTTSTAAATALELDVAVTPGHLNVATIKGTVTLAQATCRMPGTTGGSTGSGGTTTGTTTGATGSAGTSAGDTSTGGTTSGGSSTGGAGTAGTSTGGSSAGTSSSGGASSTSGATGGNLAETGGDSSTPYIAAAAAALVAAGSGALYASRRRKSQA